MHNDFYFYNYMDTINQFFISIKDLSCEILVNHTILYEKITNANYELVCNLTSEVLRPLSLTLTRNITKSLEREKLQQELQDKYFIPIN